MPNLYRAMPNLDRAEAIIPSTIKIGGRRPCTIWHQAGTSGLNDVNDAADCLAKANVLAWNPLQKFATRHLDRAVWLRYHRSNRFKIRHIQGE